MIFSERSVKTSVKTNYIIANVNMKTDVTTNEKCTAILVQSIGYAQLASRVIASLFPEYQYKRNHKIMKLKNAISVVKIYSRSPY